MSSPACALTTAPGFLDESYNIIHLTGSGTLVFIKSLRHQYTMRGLNALGVGMMHCFDYREQLRLWLGPYGYGLAAGLKRAEFDFHLCQTFQHAFQ